MLHAVTRDERHPPVTDRPHRDRSGRLAVRRVDLDLADVLEERVEAGAAEDADANGVDPVAWTQADFSFVPDDGSAGLFSPEPVPVGFSPEVELVPAPAVSFVAELFSPDGSSLLEPPSGWEALRRRESVA
jgi:hypothetical protein